MNEISYPLEQVLEVKKRRVEEAEKVVQEKVKALDKEKEILAQRQAEKEKAVQHYNDKLKQLRKELDEGTTSDEVIQMKNYLKVVQERVATEDKKVKEQEKQVAAAEKNLEDAKTELKKRRHEVDKFNAHRKDWIAGRQKELQLAEEKEQDELGNTIFTTRQYKKK